MEHRPHSPCISSCVLGTCSLHHIRAPRSLCLPVSHTGGERGGLLDIHLFSDALTQEICPRILASMRLGTEMLSSHIYVNCIIIFHLVFVHCPLELVTKDFNAGHAN